MKPFSILLGAIFAAAAFAVSTPAVFAQASTVNLSVSQRQVAGTPLRIKSTPEGIDGYCVSACTKAFPVGTAVTLSVEGANYTWEGACKGQSGPCRLTMNAAKSVELDRSSSTVKLTVTHGRVGSQGFGIVVGNPGNTVFSANPTSQTYEKGTVVTLTEYNMHQPTKFDHWEGACAGQPTSPMSCRLVMDSDKSVHAMWDDPNKTTGEIELRINSAGNIGNAFQVTPPGKMISDCRPGISSCVERFAAGTEVTITAYGRSLYVFDRFEGCDSGSGSTCRVKMTKNRTITGYGIYTGR
jgi:hypothetical protein